MVASLLTLSGVALVSWLAGVPARAAFTPNLEFDETLSVTHPTFTYGAWMMDWTPRPPDPIDGSKPQHSFLFNWADKTTGFRDHATLNIEMFFSGLEVQGKRGTPPSVWLNNSEYTSPEPSTASFAGVNGLSWANHQIRFTNADNLTDATVYNVTIKTGMITQAPTFSEVNRTVYSFVKDGQVNKDTPYVDFPWGSHTVKVLTDTVVDSGQVPQPFEAVTIEKWTDGAMIVTPPDNTSFISINGTRSPRAGVLNLHWEPMLPGYNKPDIKTTMNWGKYALSNTPLFLAPLDPEVRYTLTITANTSKVGDEDVSDMTLSSIDFLSGLWQNSTDTAGNTTGSTGRSGSSAGTTKKTNAGAIAGGVVGGVVALILIALLIVLCVRRRRRRQEELRHSMFTMEDTANLPATHTTSWIPSPYPPSESGMSDPTSVSSATPSSAALAKSRDGRLSRSTTYSDSRNHMSPFPASETTASSSRGRQEEDLGALELVSEAPEDDYVVPPLYNPAWEQEAQARALARRGGAPPPPA